MSIKKKVVVNRFAHELYSLDKDLISKHNLVYDIKITVEEKKRHIYIYLSIR